MTNTLNLIEEFNVNYDTYYDILLKKYYEYGYTDLKSIILSKSTERIANSAFMNCKSLTEIELPNSYVYIGKYAFYGCTSLSSIKLPSALEIINNSAFKLCEVLTTIVLPNTIKKIGVSAFNQCFH